MKQSHILFLFLFLAGPVFSQTASISPSGGNKGQSLPVTITGVGSNFVQGSTTLTFFRSGSPTAFIQASNVLVITNSFMAAILNIAANALTGSYTYEINTPSGAVPGSNTFLINSASSTASLSSISPTSGKRGQNLSVTITGLNSNFKQASNTLLFTQGSSTGSAISILSASATTNTSMLANIFIQGSATLGFYTLNLFNQIDGALTLPNAFEVKPNTSAASLTSVNPNNGEQGQNLEVTITGLNAHFQQASNTLIFAQGSNSADVTVTSASATTNNSILASIFIQGSASLGMYTLKLYNQLDGLLSLSDAFEVKEVSGVKDVFHNNNEVQLYPNPARDNLHLRSGSDLKTIEITDLQGRQLFLDSYQNTRNVVLNINAIKGQNKIVIVKVENTKGISFSKLILE